MIDIVTALGDPNLFGPWFAGPSWATWRAVLKGAFALKMGDDERRLFQSVAERDPPSRRVRELWCIIGRRGGKDSVASAIAAHFAAFTNWRDEGLLRPGELATVLCLATDKSQAQIVLKYTTAFFQRVALLRPLATREVADGLDLSTGAELRVLASNFRNVRGRSLACGILDEVAFWLDETSRNPAEETYQALVPSLATLPGSMLVGISTPYRRSGLLWSKFRDSYGKADDEVLVVRGPSRTFNPTLPESVVQEALKRDPAAARSEWLAEWRDDISAFLSRQLIESAVDVGVFARPPVEGEQFFAFADPSGGVADGFSCAVTHRDSGGRAILDMLHEVQPPFDPAQATKEICAALKVYGIGKVIADKYAAQWPVAEFARNDITLEHSERDRSAIYSDFLPLLTSGRARILDSPRVIGQLANLERRTQPSGRDQIGHPANANAHDNLANSAAGALVLASEESSYWANDLAWVSDGTEAVPEGPPAGVDPRIHLRDHPSFLGGWRWFGQ
jgi:hypothetical protein